MAVQPPSIPFRFKAGGASMAAAQQEPHHHRNSTKTSHKPFKSRHASKNLLRTQAKGKLEQVERGSRKTPHQQVMSKIARRNQARQQRQVKHSTRTDASSVFAGQNGAPKIVAVIPLSDGVDLEKAVHSLNASVHAQASTEGGLRVRVDRFKQNLHYVPVQSGFFETLDACRLADFVLFVTAASEEPAAQADSLIRAIEGQGISNVVTLVQHLGTISNSKKKAAVLSSIKSYIMRFFPDQEKILSLDSESECSNAVRALCSGVPKGIKWREDRSWIMIEEVGWPATDDQTSSTRSVILTGFVRGKPLNVDRLVEVGDWGHFQIEKVTMAPPLFSKSIVNDQMAVDQDLSAEEVLAIPSGNQEDISELAPYEPSMDDLDEAPVHTINPDRKGVLLDDHHYFSDDESHLPEPPKNLPRGTSSYQAAWFLGDLSGSDSNAEDTFDEEGDFTTMTAPGPQDGLEGLQAATVPEPTEKGLSEYPQSEMFLDPSPDEEAIQLEEYRSTRRKNAAEEDKEFPDEIEMHPNVLARERLARYRGLKSLKMSPWETSEDKAHEPEDWERLLKVPDYKRAKKHAENDSLIGSIPPGNRVRITLRNVPLTLQQSYDSSKPLSLFSLLKHEQKRTVVNYSFSLRSDHPNPLKSKCDLIAQCGARRFVINPVFSQPGNTPNDVHKFLRFLHPGQSAIASFIAPVTWGSVPVLYFQPSNSGTGPLEPIATGTNLPASTSRVITKRIVLTGHPYKIHKKLVTIRYMFFNNEDVAWFKALPLWTKRGRSGFIKESLGTHGYFKATFDAKINPQDAVGVSLYKRVWPKQARLWSPNEAN